MEDKWLSNEKNHNYEEEGTTEKGKDRVYKVKIQKITIPHVEGLSQ